MTIDLTPEHEKMIERVIHSGAYHNAQEVIGAALGKLAEDVEERSSKAAPPVKDMVELFAPLRGLNLEFERDRDPGRDIQF